MPRAFTAVEKETIRDRLMEAGRTCFLRYGLKKTTIDDLVKPAGVAKASFYLFFDSKEALYIDLFMAEMPAMMNRLLERSFGVTDNTRDALVLLIKGIAHEVQTNEFARIMLDDPSQIERLASSMDFNDILQRAAASYAPIVAKVVEAQARGEIVPGDPQQILYSLGLIKLLAFNRDSMPTDLYDSMMGFVPEVLANGLTYPSSNPKEAANTTAGSVGFVGEARN